MKFVDEAFIDSPGDGGNGCVSFRTRSTRNSAARTAATAVAAAMCCGRGPNLNTLVDFRLLAAPRCRRGEHGMGSGHVRAAGRRRHAEDAGGHHHLDAETGEVLYELLTPGEKIMIAKGGDGGFGNMRFKSSINRAPRRRRRAGRREEDLKLD
jgi:GTP-binding protein